MRDENRPEGGDLGEAKTAAPEENTDELAYLNLIREILFQGKEKSDRTGTGTIARLGTLSRYSLRDGELGIFEEAPPLYEEADEF